MVMPLRKANVLTKINSFQQNHFVLLVVAEVSKYYSQFTRSNIAQHDFKAIEVVGGPGKKKLRTKIKLGFFCSKLYQLCIAFYGTLIFFTVLPKYARKVFGGGPLLRDCSTKT